MGSDIEHLISVRFHVLKIIFLHNCMLSFSAQKGNLTERIVGVVISILLSIPAVLGALYLILWQTYVLRVDVILAAIQAAFIGLELVFGIVSMINFAR